MDIAQRKEQFSGAYLRVVATVAGYTLAKPEVDDDSIDWIIAARGSANLPKRPRVEVQLKCSARDMLRETHLDFPLNIKNYNDLRDDNVLVPRVLIVMLVPAEIDDWVVHSENEMLVRHCGYWMSLREMPITANTSTTTVHLPREQLFTPSALRSIMEVINHGGVP